MLRRRSVVAIVHEQFSRLGSLPWSKGISVLVSGIRAVFEYFSVVQVSCVQYRREL